MSYSSVTNEIQTEDNLPSKRVRWQVRWACYIVAGVLVTLLAARPLMGRMGTSYTGSKPEETYPPLLTIHWYSQALFNSGSSPVFCPEMSYPLGFNFGVGDGWGPHLAAAILVGIWGFPLGYNITMLLLIFGSFLFCCLFLERHVHDPRAVIVGSVISVCNVVIAGMLYRDNTLYSVCMWFIPCGLLVAGILLDNARNKSPLLLAALGGVLVLTLFTSMYQLYMLCFFLVLMALRSLVSGVSCRHVIKVTAVGVTVLLAAIMLWAAVLGSYPGGSEFLDHVLKFQRSWRWVKIDEQNLDQSFNNFRTLILMLAGQAKEFGFDELPILESTHSSDNSAADPHSDPGNSDTLGKVSNTTLTKGTAAKAVPLSALVMRSPTGMKYYLGWSILAVLCLAALKKTKGTLFWSMSGLFFLLVALGPQVSLGEVIIPNPVNLAAGYIPGMAYFRVWSKFLLMTFFCWGVVLARFLDDLWTGTKKKRAVAGTVLAVVLVVETLGGNFIPEKSTFTLEPSSATKIIMTDRESPVVFDLFHASAGWNITNRGAVERLFHQKTIIGSPFIFGSAFLELPAFLFSGVLLEECARINNLPFGSEETTAYREKVLELWSQYQIKYIVFQKHSFPRLAALNLSRGMRNIFGDPLSDDGRIALFRTCRELPEISPYLSPANRPYFSSDRLLPLARDSSNFEDLAGRLLETLSAEQ